MHFLLQTLVEMIENEHKLQVKKQCQHQQKLFVTIRKR